MKSNKRKCTQSHFCKWVNRTTQSARRLQATTRVRARCGAIHKYTRIRSNSIYGWTSAKSYETQNYSKISFATTVCIVAYILQLFICSFSFAIQCLRGREYGKCTYIALPHHFKQTTCSPSPFRSEISLLRIFFSPVWVDFDLFGAHPYVREVSEEHAVQIAECTLECSVEKLTRRVCVCVCVVPFSDWIIEKVSVTWYRYINNKFIRSENGSCWKVKFLSIWKSCRRTTSTDCECILHCTGTNAILLPRLIACRKQSCFSQQCAARKMWKISLFTLGIRIVVHGTFAHVFVFGNVLRRRRLSLQL